MVSAGNVVRIDVVANTKQAKEGFKGVQTQTQDLTKSGAGLSQTMGGIGKAMSVVGFGALSVGVVFKEVLKAGDDLTHSTTQARFSLIGMGDAGIEAFDKMQPKFRDIASEVHTTQANVATAMGILTATTNSASISATNLSDVFKVAQVTGQGFEETARALGQAMYGDIIPLNDLVRGTGTMKAGFATLAQVVKMAREEFEDSRTATDKLSDASKRWWEESFIQIDQIIGLHEKFNTVVWATEDAIASGLNTAFQESKKWLSEELGPALVTTGQNAYYFAKNIASAAFTTAENFVGNVADAGVTLKDRFLPHIKDAWNTVKDFALEMGRNIQGAAQLSIDFAVRNVSSFISLWFNLATGRPLSPESQAKINFLVGLIPRFISWFFSTATGQFIERAGNATLNFVANVSGFISRFFSKWTGVATTAVGEAIIAFRAFLPDWLNNWIDKAGKWYVQNATVHFEFLLKAGQWLWNEVMKVWNWFRGGRSTTLELGFRFTPVGMSMSAFNKLIDWATGGGSAPAAPITGPLMYQPKKTAHGGISGGGPTIVGERGPELVNLPSGSYVKPSLTGVGGGGSVTVNINESFILDESTLNRLVSMVRAELDTQLRREATVI